LGISNLIRGVILKIVIKIKRLKKFSRMA